jgi:1-acyl-sn-glycerol-3-phosphate acyltransferase
VIFATSSSQLSSAVSSAVSSALSFALTSAHPPAVLAETQLGPGVAAVLLLTTLVIVPPCLALAVRAIGNWSVHGNAVIGWMRFATYFYIHYFHRARVEGLERLPRTVGAEGLIVVSTHVAGLDPVAIQTIMPHWIRWMMSAEMMLPALGPLWRLQRVIPVCFDARDAAALKAAIAHVQAGGTLGIFPEGAIERPSRQLRPFSGGLRLILARTKAPVIVCIIDPGKPCDSAYAALLTPTRPTIRILTVVEPGPNGHTKDTSERIFALMREATGWPINEAPPEEADRATVDRNLRAYLAGSSSTE